MQTGLSHDCGFETNDPLRVRDLPYAEEEAMGTHRPGTEQVAWSAPACGLSARHASVRRI